jgi:hypothetical protein
VCVCVCVSVCVCIPETLPRPLVTVILSSGACVFVEHIQFREPILPVCNRYPQVPA